MMAQEAVVRHLTGLLRTELRSPSISVPALNYCFVSPVSSGNSINQGMWRTQDSTCVYSWALAYWRGTAFNLLNISFLCCELGVMTAVLPGLYDKLWPVACNIAHTLLMTVLSLRHLLKLILMNSSRLEAESWCSNGKNVAFSISSKFTFKTELINGFLFLRYSEVLLF